MTTRSQRSAFTLLELVVVMAIIVLIVAIAYPSLDSSYGYFKVTAAADTIKGAWAQARARAIEDGIPYRFSVAAEKGQFRIAPDRPEYWTGGDEVPEADPDRPALILEGKLPKGIRFSIDETAAPMGNDTESAPSDPEVTVDAGEWTTAAVFLPDGSARDDVQIRFQLTGTRPLTLKLRALTGTARSSFSEEDR